jgi:hypothetical protein
MQSSETRYCTHPSNTVLPSALSLDSISSAHPSPPSPPPYTQVSEWALNSPQTHLFSLIIFNVHEFATSDAQYGLSPP